MGLDNGFILRNKKTNEEKDIVYWRKHYDYRRVVLEVLKAPRDKFDFEVSGDEVKKIIKGLKPYLEENFCNCNSDTIWEYNPKALKKDIKRLKKARKLIESGDYILTFYDSY